VAPLRLHGIVRATDDLVLGIGGGDGAGPVRVLASNGLGCVLSACRGEDLGALSREELVKRLFAHQQVVEMVMKQQAVLPVKFGTVLDDTPEVLDLLRQGRSRFLDALASISGKTEIEVAATWDAKRVLQEIGQEEEVIRAREALGAKAPPTLEERVELGRLVKMHMDRRRDGYRERMVAFLRPLALDMVCNPLLSDELVMNVAFLLEQAREQEFDERIGALDGVFNNEIAFRVIGPLPPYSFSTVEITRLTSQQVAEAREALALGETISEGQVRKAYRRLAAQEQSALGGGDGQGQRRLARLSEASKLLIRYCQAQTEAQASTENDAPVRASPGRWFSIAIKRAEGADVEPARFGGA